MKKARWETAVLLCAGLVCIAIAWSTVRSLEPVPRYIPTEPEHTVKPFEPARFEGTADLITSPPQWKPQKHRLFISRLLAYFPKEKTIEPLDLNQEGADGIRYAWKLEHGFFLNDPAVAEADADEDGFSNLEEYRAQTNPRSAESSPPAVLKLRVQTYQFVPFDLVLKGYARGPAGGHEFQFNRLEDGATIFAGEGQTVKEGKRGDAWKITRFQPKMELRMNSRTGLVQEYDESELNLENSKKELTLKRNEILPSERSYVDFVTLIPGEPSIPNVELREVFEFRGRSYQLIDADEEGAAVLDLRTGEEFHIPILTQDNP